MDLFQFSILTSFFLFVIGLLFALDRSSINTFIRGFPRSLKLSVFFFGPWIILVYFPSRDEFK